MTVLRVPTMPRVSVLGIGVVFLGCVYAGEGEPMQDVHVSVTEVVEGPSTIHETYTPPQGSTRLASDAFGTSLGALELASVNEPVRTHDGRIVRGDFHVIKLPLVKGDLQQCADTAIRLRAEWLLGQGKPVMFHATSGDPMPWSRYRDGEKAYAPGNRLEWKSAPPQSWDQYLTAVFMWAGTRSLAHDTDSAEQPMAGDMLVLPGSPGHAVVILDVAKSDEHTYILAGEGYMPAQDFHIVRGPHQGWWLWDDGAQVGPWDFPASSLRRWKHG